MCVCVCLCVCVCVCVCVCMYVFICVYKYINMYIEGAGVTGRQVPPGVRPGGL